MTVSRRKVLAAMVGAPLIAAGVAVAKPLSVRQQLKKVAQANFKGGPPPLSYAYVLPVTIDACERTADDMYARTQIAMLARCHAAEIAYVHRAELRVYGGRRCEQRTARRLAEIRRLNPQLCNAIGLPLSYLMRQDVEPLARVNQWYDASYETMMLRHNGYVLTVELHRHEYSFGADKPTCIKGATVLSVYYATPEDTTRSRAQSSRYFANTAWRKKWVISPWLSASSAVQDMRSYFAQHDAPQYICDRLSRCELMIFTFPSDMLFPRDMGTPREKPVDQIA